MIRSALLALFGFGILSPHAGAVSALESSVDRIVGSSLLPNGPGAAVLVMKDNRVLLQKSYGLADVRRNRPITTRTRFDLASVSKPLTALVILRLVETGRLRLDDPVTKVIPDFRVPERGRAVVIRDLLQHTSGLADYTSSFPGNDREFAKINTETHLDWLNSTRLRRAPGSRFEYNNSNYALLALVVERVTRRPFASAAKNELFRRARMRGSFVYDGRRPLPENVASGYIVRRGQARPSSLLTDIAGDGNIYSSLRDLAGFLAALQRGRVVRATTLEQAWTTGRLADGRPIRDGSAGYGLGWEIEGPLRSHSGSWFGTSTYLEIDLERNTAVAVLSNDENLDASAIGSAIAQRIP